MLIRELSAIWWRAPREVAAFLLWGWGMSRYLKGRYKGARRAIDHLRKWSPQGADDLLSRLVMGISCLETGDRVTAKGELAAAFRLYSGGLETPRGWERDMARALDEYALLLDGDSEHHERQAVESAAGHIHSLLCEKDCGSR